jgi:C4-dicarboxylate-binding protein DctP
MAVMAPQATPVWRGAETYRDAINKGLDGKARIELFPFPGNPLPGLNSGEVQIAIISSALLASSKSTRLALFDLPFFFADLRETEAIQNSLIGEVMLGSLTDDGVVGLAYWNAGISQLFGSKPVLEANQLRGLRLRTTVSAPARTAALGLGTTAVSLAFGEVAEAVSKGAVDIVELPPTYVSQKIVPLDPMHYSNVNYRPVVSLVVASKKFWKETTLRVQTTLVDQARAVATQVNVDAQYSQQAAIPAAPSPWC